MKQNLKFGMSAALLALTISVSAYASGASAQGLTLTRAVNVVEDGKTEQYLGNNFGQTLYTFDLDQNGASACTEACAEKWPPLLVSADEAKLLTAPYATINRATNLLQVTYEGKPIYTFYLDHAEGDDKGDGLGNVWHDIDFK